MLTNLSRNTDIGKFVNCNENQPNVAILKTIVTCDIGLGVHRTILVGVLVYKFREYNSKII